MNRMQAAYRGVAREVGRSFTVEMGMTLLGAYAAFYLIRTRGRRWSNLVLYAELTWPVLGAVLVAGRLLTSLSSQTGGVGGDRRRSPCSSRPWPSWRGLGVVRRWRWWVRWGLYAGLTVLAAVVLMVVGIANYGADGSTSATGTVPTVAPSRTTGTASPAR